MAMKKKNKKIIVIVIGIVFVIAGLLLWQSTNTNTSGEFDSFAECIDNSGATFYGAFWCPHCKDQKQLFGDSERLLPYVECSAPDRKSQLQICRDAGIEGYPTWIFADKTRKTGVLSLQKLSEITGCSIDSFSESAQ